MNLDLRFAGPDDAAEICEFANEVRRVEISGIYQFRNASDCIEESQILRDCSSSNTRWIVLETPPPEENIAAATRIIIALGTATVNFIGAIGNNPSTERLLLNQLLAKVENVVRGHGIGLLTIEVSQWREDLLEWLTGCGYDEMGGYLSEDPNLTKPTFILTYKKDLSNRIIEIPTSSLVRDSPSTVADSKTTVSGQRLLARSEDDPEYVLSHLLKTAAKLSSIETSSGATEQLSEGESLGVEMVLDFETGDDGDLVAAVASTLSAGLDPSLVSASHDSGDDSLRYAIGAAADIGFGTAACVLTDDVKVLCGPESTESLLVDLFKALHKEIIPDSDCLGST